MEHAISAVNTVDNMIPAQMVAFGVLLLAAHLGGRLFGRMHLSESSGQLLGGVAAGPWVLKAIGLTPSLSVLYEGAVGSFNYFVFIFISVVAFSIGEELRISRLKTVGRSALIICLIESFATFACVSAGLYLMGGLTLIEALVVGSIGIATAPAVTFVLLNRLRVEGRLRNILGSVEIMGDILGVIIFSFLLQIAKSISVEMPLSEGAERAIVLPIIKDLILAHLAGAAIFFLLRILVGRRRKPVLLDDDADTSNGLLFRMLAEHPSPSVQIFVVVVGAVAVGAGVAYYFHIPFILSAAFAGFLVANFHSHAIFDSLKINNISSLFSLAFFAIVGSTVRLDAFDGSTAVLVLVYVASRTFGKVSGTWLGCKIMREDRKIASCLPYLMFPQAAVAAVEAVYASAVLGNILISTIILPAIVLFEIGGAIMSERTLKRWRTWVAGEEEAMKATKSSAPSEALRLLLSILRPGCIALDLQEDSKEAILKDLLDRASDSSPNGINRDEAFHLIMEREALMPTGMGHGIAIPHCRLLDIDQPIMVWCRHRSGVVFGGVDDQPCHLIVMIISNVGDPNEHMRLLSASAHLLANEDTRQQLFLAKTEDEFVRVIRNASK